ncbi:uncharacterized protein [Melanerpes formicivorus]|uniref:uncharacterized protein isoform X2 n=1 Tax=Melanerpes formicivorus TaxID=211600 RepID=UPI00358ED2C5
MSFKGLLASSSSLADPSPSDAIAFPSRQNPPRQLAPCGAPHALTHRLPSTQPASTPSWGPHRAECQVRAGRPSVYLQLLETSSGRPGSGIGLCRAWSTVGCSCSALNSHNWRWGQTPLTTSGAPGVLALESPRSANGASRRALTGRRGRRDPGMPTVAATEGKLPTQPLTSEGAAGRATQTLHVPTRREHTAAQLPPPFLSPGRMSSPQGQPDGALARSDQGVECMEEAPGVEKQELAVHTWDSDGAEADVETPEEPLLSFPSELSVLERLGLHRAALTEQDVEAAFAHLALAFRCDMFTLQQRVQVEKRARDAAEENIQEELSQCRAALEKLGPFCTDMGCKEMLVQLQHSLTVLAAAVERATSAAEKLGAVHQEARMSRATEVMVQHVENLKRHHVREHTELEEMKRLIQQNSRNRQLAETQDDVEPRLRPHPLIRTFQQGSARRRVSIAVIPKQLLPGASPESRAAPAGELEREKVQCQHSTERSELEPQGQGSTVTEELAAEVDSRGSSAEVKKPEQSGLMSKGSPVELCRSWLFLPQHYWVFFWLLLLSITFLFLIRVLELQWLQPVASPKA